MASFVTRRTQEIGIRLALGGRRSDILRLIVGEGAPCGARGNHRSRRILRYRHVCRRGDASSADALLASYLPARRAMQLDPNTALRYE
jgi:putative ABC transport system permease protein